MRRHELAIEQGEVADPEPGRGLPAWLGLADARRFRYRTALGLCEERPDSFTIA